MNAESVLSQSHFYIHGGPLRHVVWDRDVSLCHVLELAEITLACRGWDKMEHLCYGRRLGVFSLSPGRP